MRILVVDDSADMVEMLRIALVREGNVVDAAGTGREALWAARETRYSAIILDGRLPDLDGFEVCARLRQQGCDAPILMLTGRDGVAERVAGLDSGADDYLVKPVQLPELSARLRALSRRSPQVTETVLAADDLVLDPARHRVERAGTEISLTPKEFALLHLLLAGRGAVLTRRQIIDGLWDFAAVADGNNIDVHIRNLRGKIDKPFAVPLIETVRGIGYRIRTD